MHWGLGDSVAGLGLGAIQGVGLVELLLGSGDYMLGGGRLRASNECR